jgi:hypothetical protein
MEVKDLAKRLCLNYLQCNLNASYEGDLGETMRVGDLVAS